MNVDTRNRIWVSVLVLLSILVGAGDWVVGIALLLLLTGSTIAYLDWKAVRRGRKIPRFLLIAGLLVIFGGAIAILFFRFS